MQIWPQAINLPLCVPPLQTTLLTHYGALKNTSNRTLKLNGPLIFYLLFHILYLLSFIFYLLLYVLSFPLKMNQKVNRTSKHFKILQYFTQKERPATQIPRFWPPTLLVKIAVDLFLFLPWFFTRNLLKKCFRTKKIQHTTLLFFFII